MESERLLAQGFEELRTDLKGFLQTRYEILRMELSSAFGKLRTAGLLLGIAALFGILGLTLLAVCVSLAIAFAFGALGGQAGLIWGFLITGGGCALVAVAAGMAGKARINAEELTPKRTLRVLERDQESLRKGAEKADGDQSFSRTA